jgi:hypothetical protein
MKRLNGHAGGRQFGDQFEHGQDDQNTEPNIFKVREAESGGSFKIPRKKTTTMVSEVVDHEEQLPQHSRQSDVYYFNNNDGPSTSSARGRQNGGASTSGQSQRDVYDFDNEDEPTTSSARGRQSGGAGTLVRATQASEQYPYGVEKCPGYIRVKGYCYCNYCDQHFDNKTAFIVHHSCYAIRRIDEAEQEGRRVQHDYKKSFDCEFCPMRVSSIVRLKWHTYGHFEPAFFCSTCPFNSHRQDQMKRHVMKVHS